MGDIPLCWCGKPSRDPERYDWCGKCKTPSDPEIASAWQNRRELVEQRDSYKAKAEELELSLNIATDGRNHWWERQVGEITDRLMTIVDDEIDPMPTAGPHESMDRIVAGLRAFRAEAEEWQARAEALAGVLREIAKPVDCPADEVALWDELSAKAALNAYDAANTSEGSGEALPPPQAEGSSPKAPEPLRASLPGDTEHKRLLKLVVCKPEDYQPWGQDPRWERPDRVNGDCSSGCKWARWLEGDLAADWCVCTNPASHRCGLLTFEHQGCQKFEAEPDDPDGYHGLETYIPGLGTVRECIGCSCLVPGGPTRCRRCANEATCAKG